MIFDGYGNHGTIQFVIYVYEHNIVLIYLPLYIIYRLQPLDVAIFSLLAKYYFEIVKDSVVGREAQSECATTWTY